MADYRNLRTDLTMFPEQSITASASGAANMEAHATASAREDLSTQKTKAAFVDGTTVEAPSAKGDPTGIDVNAANEQNLVTPLASIAPGKQNVSPSFPPPHEASTEQKIPTSSPVQTPLLLTYNNSKEEAHVQEPSKAIVKVSTDDDDGKKKLANIEAPRVLPSVGAFTVQCALCMKWRLIPTKEQYEEIRQSVLEKPFFCSSTVSWRPDASCEDPSDVLQDESHLWAIDRPNIPVAPRGWERQLVIRAAGASKFADVYYVAPSGRKLRSMPEVERFLAEFPEYVHAGVKQSQFSFIIPRPLDSNYCRKKTAGPSSPSANNSHNQKLSSTNKSKKSQGSKLSIKRKAFESLSSKEDSEEQMVTRKKSSVTTIVAQKPEKGSEQDGSYDSLISQQVVKGLLPPEELAKGLSWGFSVPKLGSPDHASALPTPQQHPTKSNNPDAALQNNKNQRGKSSAGQALSLGKEQNTSTQPVPVHSTPSTDASSFQDRPTGMGS